MYLSMQCKGNLQGDFAHLRATFILAYNYSLCTHGMPMEVLLDFTFCHKSQCLSFVLFIVILKLLESLKLLTLVIRSF